MPSQSAQFCEFFHVSDSIFKFEFGRRGVNMDCHKSSIDGN